MQVQIGGTWGEVCFDGWTKEDAAVACREAGLAGGTPAALAPGASPFVIGNVACGGSEARLASCAFDLGSRCLSGKAAGVTCKSELRSLRSVGGGGWKSVCSQLSWMPSLSAHPIVASPTRRPARH